MSVTKRVGLRKNAKAVWQADGRWGEAIAFRTKRVAELMKTPGRTRAEAGRMALDEALVKFPLPDPSGISPMPEVSLPAPESQPPVPEALPAALEGDSKPETAPEVLSPAPPKALPEREPTKSEIIDWIFYHIGDRNITQENALCSAAWYWMTQVRANPMMKGDLFAKAMPSRAQIEAIERRKDGKEPTCDLIRRFFEHVPILPPSPEGTGGKSPVPPGDTTGDLG